MKRIIILLSCLLLVSPVYAGFTINSDSVASSICPTTTELVTIELTNLDNTYQSYTFGLSGEAASWTAMAPAGMMLAPNERSNVYLYITPSLYAQTGNYNLRFTTSSSGRIEHISLNVEVPECNGLSITSQNNQRSVCSGTTGDFYLTLNNDGRWTETYDLIVSGETSPWASLSKTSMTLLSGASESFNLYITPSETDHGIYPVTVTAQSRTTNAVVSEELILNSEDCYDFDLSASENFVSFCDNSEVKIPIIIENFGSEQNQFELELDGNKWSSLSADQLTISAGSSKTFDLILSPGVRTPGNYQFKINADSVNSDKTDSTTVTANVLSCRKSTMTVATDSIDLCPGDSKNVDVLLLNSGRFEETYALSVGGIAWASFEDSLVKLDPEESEMIGLNLVTDHSTKPGNYRISISANVQSLNSKSLNSIIDVMVRDQKSCYSLSADSDSNVKVGIGTGSLIPVTLKNTGTRTDTYQITLAGAASQYAQVNPGAVTLEGNSEETVYLFISLPRDAEIGLYDLKLIAESDRSSVTVPINIIAKQGEVDKVLSDINEITSHATGHVTEKFTEFTSTISAWIGSSTDWIKKLVISEDSYLVRYWYVFPIILLIMLFSMFRTNNESWMKDLELLEKDLEMKPRKKKTLIDTMTERWVAHKKKRSRTKVVTKTISKLKPKKSKKQTQFSIYWKKFNVWLNEEVDLPIEKRKNQTKKSKPKKKSKSYWQKFITWLDSEPKPKSKKKKSKPKPKKKSKKQKSMWKKFLDWLDEE